MMRRISILAAVFAVVACATVAVQAAPMFYLSTDSAPGNPARLNSMVDANSTGVLNIFARSDVRLSGVSLELVETGGGIKFTGANLNNPTGRWTIAATPTVTESLVTSLDGGAIPGIAGEGIGAGSPAGADTLFGTVNFMANGAGTSNLQLRVGNLVIADWDGNNPMVGFGDGPANIPGGVPGGAGVAGTITVGIIPEPATMSLVGLAMLGLLGLTRRRK